MLVLFDIDETLLDHRTTERAAATALHRIADVARPLGDFVAAWAEALERNFARYLSGELSYEDQRRARIREVVDPELSDEAADRLLARYLDAYLAGAALFPDVLPCLDRLAGARHRLGIISNGQTDHQRIKLVRCGITERFEHILISEECGHAKPAPEIFAQACARMGEPATRAVYIGDRYDVDAEGARRAGLRGVWLDRGARAGAEHQPPIISSLDELDALLEDGSHPST
jgi:putative hydrolase of the HAD superfamily